MTATFQSDKTYTFDGFQLDVRKRVLLRHGEPVQLTSKAFELLLALVENSSREIGKDELMERIWGGQMVEDANLTVTMSHLRKALGEKAGEHRFIVTIPGRGYCFVGELQRDEGLIVEQHSVSQIVIEHDTDVSAEPIIKTTAETKSLLPGNGRLVTSPESADVLTRGSDVIQTRRRPYLRLFPAGATILALSLVVTLGFWLFRSRFVAPLIPFSQATIKQLTTKGNVRWAALSPDGRFYAYSLREKGSDRESLWLAQIDSTNDIQIRPPADVFYNVLTFSPDGKTVYFSLSSAEQSQQGLFKIPVLGGVSEKLSDHVRAYFAISPDGNRIAFFRTNYDTRASSLIVGHIDGSGERELATRPADKPFSNRLAWSRDGSLLAAVAVGDAGKDSREVFVIRPADGKIEQLTKLDWNQISNLGWLPDGRGMIIVATDRNETVRHLWYVEYPSGHSSLLSRDTDSYGSGLGIAANGDALAAVQIRRESNIWVAPTNDLAQGQQITFSSVNGVYGMNGLDWRGNNGIVFAAGVDRTLAIYTADADGRNIKQITSAGFFDQRPKATPDGRLVVFQSNRSGANEIWRVNADASDLRQLTKGGGNSLPYPTPDGKWVVYNSNQAGQSLLRRVSIDGGEAVPVGNQACFSPSVAPDGKLIACGYGASEDQLKLAIVKIEDGSIVKLFDAPHSARFADGLRWSPGSQAVCYRDSDNGVWRQDLSGVQPARLPGLPEEQAYSYAWSADGKHFAVTRGRTISDIVLIKNVN